MGRIKYAASHGNDKSKKQSHAVLTEKVEWETKSEGT